MAHWCGVFAATIPPMLATIGDPEGTRTVTSLIALLVALGLALVMVAIWLFKTTRPDPELLAPLEAMGERNWRRLDPVGQRRRLDELRPEGAEPIAPSVAPPEFDSAFDAGPAAPGFDDLRDDGQPDVHVPLPTGAPLTSLPQADTPQQLDRPGFDEFDVDGVDSEIIAAASAELEAELAAQQPESVDASADEPTSGP